MTSPVATKELTVLDLIKGLSMFVMITDHVGYYFYPADLWFRAFGRIDFPVWFFLPGYSKSRAFEWSWVIGGAMLVAGNLITGYSLLPANAIFTIMLIRFGVDRITGYMTSTEARRAAALKLFAVLLCVLAPLTLAGIYGIKWPPALEMQAFTAMAAIDGAAFCWAASYALPGARFWLAALALALSFPVSFIFFEYGTLGLIIGVFGWLCRNRETLSGGARRAAQFGIFCWIAFSALQEYMFRFETAQFALMSLGTGLYLWILYAYRPGVFPAAEKKAGWLPVALVRFLGRHTLEIYVFHLLLFKAIRLWYHPELFMKWHAFVGAGAKALI